VTDVYAKGFDPESDVDAEFYSEIRKHAEELTPGVPLGKLKQLIERVGGDGGTGTLEPESGNEPETNAPYKTHRERLKDLSKEIAKEFQRVDGKLKFDLGLDVDWKHTATECMKAHGGVGLPQCKTLDELQLRKRWLAKFKKRHGI